MTRSGACRLLSVETNGAGLSDIHSLLQRVGGAFSDWAVHEVGDGDLNLVFVVKGPDGDDIINQALPCVRLVGHSWSLPLDRVLYEQLAVAREAARDPGAVPEILDFDAGQTLIVMEFLSSDAILQRKLIAVEQVKGLGARVETFCARTAFRGSEPSLESETKKAEGGLFSGNWAIHAITEALVFTDPCSDAR